MQQRTCLCSLLVVVAAALAVGAAACSGGSDHPGPAGDTSDERTAATEPLTAGAETPGTHRFNCVPLSSRECRIYYRDSGGILHCPADIEVCRPDGKGFFGCGEYSVTAGQLIARTPTGKPPLGK